MNTSPLGQTPPDKSPLGLGLRLGFCPGRFCPGGFCPMGAFVRFFPSGFCARVFYPEGFDPGAFVLDPHYSTYDSRNSTYYRTFILLIDIRTTAAQN